MNNFRRKKISKVIENLEQNKNELENILSVEECHFDNIPENLQDGEIAEKSQNAIDNLEEAISNLESTIENLEEAKS